MRYSKNENVIIICEFSTGDSVTIDVYDIDDNSKITNAVSMSEVATTGVFQYSFSANPQSKKDFLWIATNGVSKQVGHFTKSGYIDNLALESSIQSLNNFNPTTDDVKKVLTVVVNEDFHNKMDSYGNKDDYKANVSSVGINATSLHSSLDSYTNKDSFKDKADVSNIEDKTDEIKGVVVPKPDPIPFFTEISKEINRVFGRTSTSNEFKYYIKINASSKEVLRLEISPTYLDFSEFYYHGVLFTIQVESALADGKFLLYRRPQSTNLI